MKNTTFRKKALLSSVAMLLVALVALGSATFAWFAANPNADATGITAKTTASSGLVIKTETENAWTHNAKLFVGKDMINLQPANQDQDEAGTLVGFEAAGATNWASKTGTKQDLDNGVDYYAEKIYFRLSDNSAEETNANVKIESFEIKTKSGANLAGAVRLAVADQNGKVLATFTNSTAGKKDAEGNDIDPVLAPYGTDDGTAYGGAGLLTAVPSDPIYVLAEAGLTAGVTNNKFVTVYVYLDGQDTSCYSENVNETDAEQIIESVKVNFTLVTNPA